MPSGFEPTAAILALPICQNLTHKCGLGEPARQPTATVEAECTASERVGRTMDAQEHEDLRRLLNELAAKGYRPAQLEVVRSEWEAACQAGAHPDLAAAAHALDEHGEQVRPS